MNDTDVFHTLRRERLIGAWRGLAQLGMLVDGRTHTWAGETAASGPELRKSSTGGRAARAPRLARLVA